MRLQISMMDTQHFCISVFIISSIHFSTQSSVLVFSNQNEAIVDKSTNFAILNTGEGGVLHSSSFTICSSIFIGFFRGKQAFFTIRNSDSKNLWFQIGLASQDLDHQTYIPFIEHSGGAISGNNSIRLTPHAWSHACSTIDQDSGHVTVVINGILTHDATIVDQTFLVGFIKTFRQRLVLGCYQTNTYIEQSEASVTNVNIFSIQMTNSDMQDKTKSGEYLTGDILPWENATFNLFGNVSTLKSPGFCTTKNMDNIFLLGKFEKFDNCKALCPRFEKKGRIPMISQTIEQNELPTIWAGFVYQRAKWGIEPAVYFGIPENNS